LDADSARLTKAPAHYPIFYVRDNGIGILEKHLGTIFQIFKRLHAPTKYGSGTGAGLTIAKKIVERHHGKIWVESIVDLGSTFYFTLKDEEENHAR
jgi:two-component system, chemotaxis family, sensor kinase Cph1